MSRVIFPSPSLFLSFFSPSLFLADNYEYDSGMTFFFFFIIIKMLLYLTSPDST